MSEENDVKDNVEEIAENNEIFLYCDGMVNFGDVGALYTETPETPTFEFDTHINIAYDDETAQPLAEVIGAGDVEQVTVGGDKSIYEKETTYSFAVDLEEDTEAFSLDCMEYEE